MELCLPPVNGVKPHISGSTFNSYRNRPTTGNKHAAVDFNYIGGQAFNRKQSYTVHSPVNGTIDSKYGYDGRFGIIVIKDEEGYYHGILHLIGIIPRVGASVSVGTTLGIMAGKGPNGRFQYDVHVHYQLRNPDGVLIDPVAHWEGEQQVYTAPVNPEDLDPHAEDPGHYNAEPGSGTGSMEDYVPRQAGISEFAVVGYACWTNRVPMHEPWPRTLMVDTPNLNAMTDQHEYNINHNPQFDDTTDIGSMSIGRVEGEEEIDRGPFWRR